MQWQCQDMKIKIHKDKMCIPSLCCLHTSVWWLLLNRADDTTSLSTKNLNCWKLSREFQTCFLQRLQVADLEELVRIGEYGGQRCWTVESMFRQVVYDNSNFIYLNKTGEWFLLSDFLFLSVCTIFAALFQLRLQIMSVLFVFKLSDNLSVFFLVSCDTL